MWRLAREGTGRSEGHPSAAYYVESEQGERIRRTFIGWGVEVVQHGILEPKWDEVGVLGKGGIRLVLETELGGYDAHEGKQGATHNKESKLEQRVHVGLEGRECGSSGDRNLATDRDWSIK